ncbi:MAG: VCBS repeat-containing protein [Deltaproteobacteria bacterium]|nr:VCBS repeat-containing protein [Deltaproteobacteria bacterium]
MVNLFSRYTRLGWLIFFFTWGTFQVAGDTPVYGATYYVAATGADTNPGTSANPWKTITKAANTLVAGDTVYITAGTYSESVTPKNSGSPDNYITYAANPGDTVTIDGTNQIVPDPGADIGVITISQIKYIKISGFKITNGAAVGIMVDRAGYVTVENNSTLNTVSSGIRAWSSDNVIIDGNEVQQACNGGAQECISLSQSSNFEVRNNEVHFGVTNTSGGEGIDAKNGSYNGRIYKNSVHNLFRIGIYVDAWNQQTSNIEVFQNIIHDCQDYGIVLGSEMGGLLQGIKVYNNITHHNMFSGIYVSSDGASVSGHPMQDIQIINNTCYANGWNWGGCVLISNANADNVVVRNNLCSQNNAFQLSLAAVGRNFSADHNLIDGFRNASGEIFGDNSVTAAPLFLNASTSDLHLTPSSPAIDAGSSVDAPAFDYDGRFRPQGQGWDIGAYEYPKNTNFDFNGDGKADILWRSTDTGQVWMYLMNGMSIAFKGVIATVNDLNWQIQGIGDFNGDGEADILWRNTNTGQVWMLLMNGPAIASNGPVATVSDLNWQIQGIGDFNGDGKADILWRNTDTGQVWILFMDGTTISSNGPVAALGDLSWQIQGIGDFNGDGKADILWRNTNTGQAWMYLMDGTSIVSQGPVATLGDLSWQIQGIGDFNGDGKAGILWRNTNTGQVWMYLMDGTSIASQGPVATPGGSNWTIQGIADFNGDGEADILWRNTNTGQVWMYLMNGTSIASQGSVAIAGDLNWTIQGIVFNCIKSR